MTDRSSFGRQAAVLVIVVALGLGAFAFERYREPRMAREAVLNVAGATPVSELVKRSWPGRRTSLWCGAVVGRGLVAVTIRNAGIPGFLWVQEVAPEWVEARSATEDRMLAACGAAPSGPPALA